MSKSFENLPRASQLFDLTKCRSELKVGKVAKREGFTLKVATLGKQKSPGIAEGSIEP